LRREPGSESVADEGCGSEEKRESASHALLMLAASRRVNAAAGEDSRDPTSAISP
jgi:hypothetical protein